MTQRKFFFSRMHFFLQRTMIFWNLLSCFYIFVVVWKMKCQCCCYERFSFQFCFIFGILHFCFIFWIFVLIFQRSRKLFQQSRKLFTQQNKTERNTNIIQWQKGKKKKVQFLLHLVLHEKTFTFVLTQKISDHLLTICPKRNKTKRNKTKETRHKTKETRQKKQDTRQKKQDTRQKKQDTRQKKQDKIKHTQPNLKKKKQKISKNRHNNENKKQKQKAYSTSTSRVVPHRSTMLAASNLTARFRWDVVYFRSYGRKQKR